MLCESQARETEAYDALVTGAPKKQELARRLLTLFRTFHQPPAPAIASQQNPTGGLSMGPPAPRLVLQPGELDKVNEFLSTLRSGVQAPTQPLTATAQHRSVVLTTPDASDAASPSPWSSFMSSAGVGASSATRRASRGLSFWCPLLEFRRGVYSGGMDALTADCREQVRKVKGWARPPDASTVRTAGERAACGDA